MSTTTYNPDGSLSMTGNEKPAEAQKPAAIINIVAVANGWMVFSDESDWSRQVGGVPRPTFVFNNVDEMLGKVRELLAGKPRGSAIDSVQGNGS